MKNIILKFKYKNIPKTLKEFVDTRYEYEPLNLFDILIYLGSLVVFPLLFLLSVLANIQFVKEK